ncbi:hypothetical protein TCAL_02090 [Tigriopus californicus]|uniref:Dynein heavy chain, cytoplasmic n=1 Tax=Tigriopus californicus TaxID=6832 RepID=A0A553NDG0_TIGCA|nr:hypothetical protein TCAL_02090 [Tigriopus californicus]|eukprot:TCALIF_02090-PA protein Name:"Similar to Dhc64C Dynein heavy chain, cytoplasmic (Drosophila melanogaster)" AED:0.01 eAED:0.01 QI:234/0.66/0.42/1/1/0.85/7/0/4571
MEGTPPPTSHGGVGSGEESLENPAPATLALLPVDKLVTHVVKVVLVVFEDSHETELRALMEARAHLDLLSKFIADHHCKTLMIERVSSKEDEDAASDKDKATPSAVGLPPGPLGSGGGSRAGSQGPSDEGAKDDVAYHISINVHYSHNKMTSVVFVKRAAVLEAEKSLSSQLRLLTLSEGSPYETLHAYVSSTMAPYFKSFVRESGKADRDGDKMASSMEKKIAELEMGLLHLQQNIDIPEITLSTHPSVSQVIRSAEAQGVKPQVSDLGEKIEDSTFLNALTHLVSKWIREIQKVTKLDRDPASGTALQEISFWLNLERALLRIQEKRESPEVGLTLDILKHGKRFHATVSFDTDTGLKQAIATVNDYNPLMKDFPINDLLSATEIDRVRGAVQSIFTHLRKIRNTKYPIQRALRLVEAISRDLVSQLLKVLNTRRLMYISFEEFEKVMGQCADVFTTWDDEYDKLQGLMRDIVKRKRDEHLKMVWRVNFAHKKLQARIEQMRKFRRQHEQLRTVIVRVLRPGAVSFKIANDKADDAPVDVSDVNSIEEVNLAYDNVKEVDGLDISKEGTESWEEAMKRYDDRIDRVETRITSRLRDQLGTAKNANEMFRIFSRFNALFVRPHIRGAIREYQTQLIQRVKDDIETLHAKFKIQYPQSKSYRMSGVRDLPPVAGSIVWAKQIDRQLSAYMRRVEDVLGKGWENHVEGQKLKADGDSFRMKLNTQEIFDEWARKVQQRNLGVSGRIFTVDNVRNRTGRGSSLRLRVNFLPEIIQLSKEVRNLKNLGFRVPLAIVNKAHQANQLYPFAISLIESVRTYERSLEKMDLRPNIVLLVAGMRKEVQNLIAEGIGLVWESYKLDPYVQKLAEVIVCFQEKVDDLLLIEEEIEVDVRSLETCNYSTSTFTTIIGKIQKAVDDLSLHQYSNLHAWVDKLDEEVEKKLAVRLQAGIEEWTAAMDPNPDQEDESMDTDSPNHASHKIGGNPNIKTQIHEIRITNQIMYLHPSIEDCRYNLLQQFFQWQAVITSLPRIESTRYQVGLDRPIARTFKEVLTKFPAGQAVLEKAYSGIETTIDTVKAYVDEWLRYQSLWDLQPDSLVQKFKENVDEWMRLLADIKRARSTFDTSDTRKDFGPVIIDYGKVQSKVSLKYDSWHKDALTKFGGMLGQEMTQFHAQISKARSDLEMQTIDAAATGDAVNFITDVQSLKRKMKVWDKQVGTFKDGQRILERQRFQFPTSWLHVDNIEGEWSAFNEILRRKNQSIQSQVASLQMKIVAEDKQIETRSMDYVTDWDKNKPVQGSVKPSDALQKIQVFESRYTRLKEERDNISKAKEALELDSAKAPGDVDEKLGIGWEELMDLKGVWTELSSVWKTIDELKETPWLSVQPRKLRQQLDALLTQLRDMPARLRQYSGYEYVRKQLQTYAKVNLLITELKSDALKERHWKTLCKEMKVAWIPSDLALGQVWDVDLIKNEAIIKDIMSVAQGEMALEEFLKQVKETWQFYELELVNYQNKCKLIKGWDELFSKLKENMSQITAMKLSPYYKVFEEETLTWEEKLNRILNLFDVWIDVQRRWVYLEGIFSGNADIASLLPIETSRFGSISTEFLNLMKKVAKIHVVIDILNIQGIQRSLERLAELLSKVQKALGEYLERERASFPRFYFVGDEDLLEIIGNSNNMARLQKHFKKMFAGVHALLISEDELQILGIASKEGEEVRFVNPIVIAQFSRINEWLLEVEKRMRESLAFYLQDAVSKMDCLDEPWTAEKLIAWCDENCAQVVVLSVQVHWTTIIEKGLASNLDRIKDVLKGIDQMLSLLSTLVLEDQPAIRRKKLEHLIYEFVHRRSLTRSLINSKVDSNKSYDWLSQMRFYHNPQAATTHAQLSIHMANAQFEYGFEYLGVQDRLVMTPLTDRCYLTMTQALSSSMGGSPFGPAGTGKTETVKALGNQLGRFVLVFNCDETFDFQAMGRIFVGLCQVGAWGCFDEFNRLEERMLSAVSQQILSIQECLKGMSSNSDYNMSIDIIGKRVKVNPDMAIFITMNPGYAGRSNLPDNLKKLFRSMAMTKPDITMIAEVMLFAQGFNNAEKLSQKIVPLFKLCSDQLSPQSHYDFGLRAMKSVLVSAGNIKRAQLAVSESQISDVHEQKILVQSVSETMVPKLIANDIPLLQSLMNDVFPSIIYTPQAQGTLRTAILEVCKELHLCCGGGSDDMGEKGEDWMDKVLQLYQISELHHGLMMVGPSGAGKSMAWKVLLKALEKFDGKEGVSHVINPKAISKEDLYGVLDPTTREWRDGLFTHVLRRIIDNVRGELFKRQWIVFDGDVDPEWVENLNSVLDDNRLLTLPNGERLSIPNNVRIMFEVKDLKFATLATVSRCGMVWFSEDVVTPDMMMAHYLEKIRNISLDDTDDDMLSLGKKASHTSLEVQGQIASILSASFDSNGLVMKCLEYAASLDHIMEFTKQRALESLFSMINQSIRNVLTYNQTHNDFPLNSDQLEKYIPKSLAYSIVWSFSGDSKFKCRESMSEFIRSVTTIPLPATSGSNILDYEVTVQGDWVPWVSKVPQVEIETHKVGSPDVVIPTIDTVRHESLLYTWLADHKPMVLCGPPGSGKTMTLFSALRSLPDMEVVGLNFSSATTPELLMKTFDHYCEYKKTPKGLVLAPNQIGKWLVMFCDEINLPDEDGYGTQKVISFLRQLVEYNGFYRKSDHAWVSLERVQFVGACNPPTDPGRKPLGTRFLRHIPVIYVDYPGQLSLQQIYGTFTRAMLRLIPPLRSYAEPLTNAMVDFFLLTQENFTQEMQPHYVYSPRELTRWVRGMCEALRPLDALSLEGMVRIWTHEALRLFHDRLVDESERVWTNENIDATALKHFPNINKEEALNRPILYSNWTTKDYVPIEQEELRQYVHARLRVFHEEELDVPLVLFDDVLDHILRIDRIFRQPQGHLLLIGVSGSGKTTLSRFVAWMNGMRVFQIKVHNKYNSNDFDDDLRHVLRRAGCKNEKIAFILDESNVMESSFLERMNTLLANGEVPGLFEGDEYATLMTQCKEGAQKDGLMLDSSEELYRWFTNQVMKNLHVVFTMNPSEGGLKDRAATSPALFNRCVLNWFGDWSEMALFQVGKELTIKMDLDKPDWTDPGRNVTVSMDVMNANDHRCAVINSMVFVHKTLQQVNKKALIKGQKIMSITPRHFLDFIHQFVTLYREKRANLEEEQLHLNVGLNKIAETVQQVEEMQKSLAVKSAELEKKNTAANAKLKQMVMDQQEAEKQKSVSQNLQKLLETQKLEIAQKRTEVMSELEQVEPAVQDAQQAVKGIRKQQLVEVRSMSNPPMIVKLALESVCLLLGESAQDWKQIRGVTMKDNFIPTIVNFDTDSITDDVREKMKNKFLSNPDYNFEKVNRASQACGPLVKWATAQLQYAEMLKKVDPLRNELASLEKASHQKQEEADKLVDVINKLEHSINSYKEEYAQLISQAEAIKSDLKQVQDKVDRSMSLLKSLGIEKERWQETSENFKYQMATIIGDVFVCAAFLAYGGYYDQHTRRSLLSTWKKYLENFDIALRGDMALTEFLSDPDERARWKSHSLPSDDLCLENAVMLKRYNRYPLIIDPSGQATAFIMEEYADRKITKTSFLDDSFRKNLESALRFGNPLLVQDVENYDPILNPVLNRELRRTGGRVLMTLADQDIDISPTFTIFLATRDPTVEFAPDICSRVTMVNFTVTRSSLQMQCLNQVLKSERPDIDQKRSDLLKIQGEFQLRLRHLEKDLLQCLNEAKGRILDDNTIISTLETLKQEAAEVGRKVNETETVMAEIESTSQMYTPLSNACSSIYFMMDNLHQIHFIYQFSLQFFLDILVNVLKSLDSNVKNHTERVDILTSGLFSKCYVSISRGMLHKDKILLAFVLSRVFVRGFKSENENIDEEIRFMLQIKDMGIDGGSDSEGKARILRDKYRNSLNFDDNSSEFKQWLASPNPEDCVPDEWIGSEAENKKEIVEVILTLTYRPDRLSASVQKFVKSTMGSSFNIPELDASTFHQTVETDVKSTTPILMCSVPGYDASDRVADMALQVGKEVSSIALGSEEGFSLAEKSINSSSKSGKWVLLKNVHLAPQWLITLEKKLHSIQAHPDFRLFLTCEISKKIPVNLLRAGRIFTFEPPPGIKANLIRTFSLISPQRMVRPPNERARLYFLLAWFHAIAQERLRYVPLGWSKHYEFNESDLKSACDMLDNWVDIISQGRTNLPPERVPWKAIQSLLSDVIYGGKIDNDFDRRLLDSFVSKLFQAKTFDFDHKLLKTEDLTLTMPEDIRREHFIKWIETQLPEKQAPTWLGLPANAEKVMLIKFGQELLNNLERMNQIDLEEDDDQLAFSDDQPKKSEETSVSFGPAWFRLLSQSLQKWLTMVPVSLPEIQRSAETVRDPLFRYIDREIYVGKKVLNIVLTDLNYLNDIGRGERKQTNHYQNLGLELVRGIVPNSWRRYRYPPFMTVSQWIQNLVFRLKQLETIINKNNASGAIGLPTSVKNVLKISDVVFTEIPRLAVRWIKKGSVESGEKSAANFAVPFYLNSTRNYLLCRADFALDPDTDEQFIERGIAFVADI